MKASVSLASMMLCLAMLSGCVSQGDVRPVQDSGFCGVSAGGACSADSDCVRGGCSGQVCQSRSDPPAITTCEYSDCYDPEPYYVVCGCLDGACDWRRAQYNPITVGK